MSARIVSRFDSIAFGGTEVDPDRAWIACTQPERPPDKNVMYHVYPDCHACNIAKIAAARVGSQEATDG